MVPSARFPRRVGLFERYRTTLHLLGLEACIVASAQFTTAIGAALTPGILFPALRAVIEKHAALGVRLEGDLSSSKARFVKLQSIDLSQIVDFKGGSDLRTALETQLARQFDTDTNLPLWRVEVLKDSTVIFAVHHAIGDGLSSFVFHTALLTALQNVQTEDASPYVQVPATSVMLPPMEDFTTLRPSFRQFGVDWPSVISNIIAEDSERTYKTICTNVAISLREVANFPADAFGDVVSVHHSYMPVCSEFDWETAARYSATLKLQKSAARTRVGMLRLLFGNYILYLRDGLGQKRAAAFIHSNVGRYAPEPKGRWRIGNTFFAQNESVVGPAFSINVVGDPSGGVNATVSWGDKSLDRAFAESFVTQFQATFHRIIE
ncbi:hypothetical protein C8J57DRAFT_1608809 [Mycena rebaudengoi]|nr:hypothetical protein C8J57DRAFT_1608809 [Mycena rebaudengoi]